MERHDLMSLAAAGRELGPALNSSCKSPRASDAICRLGSNFVAPLPQRHPGCGVGARSSPQLGENLDSLCCKAGQACMAV